MKHEMRAPAPEFSRRIIADTVSTSGTGQEIVADAQERAALARRLDLVSIDKLTARVKLRRVRGEYVRVTGEIEADVVQSCVVTLEPVPAHVNDSFEALFAPDHLVPDEEDEEVEVTFSGGTESDIPEAMDNGSIDIGELAAQHLSLALDPYPRKPGVSFEEIDDPYEEDAREPERPNPFAKLASLKRPT
ncbi:YceD family protein [Indioceanicola profundi]|uniref:YceD family protein n=1 Tax=Indioceanicola profundi TaxID=2220096 RepID=UPI000E6A9F3B|nr:DUF177 domain-containing protein [Indioceanicola profundi]